jgi:aryl-alcohol dehydrogenase-like predicted oxidoreductase
MRVFGRTGIRLSVLGFGCGAVGGLMVRGDPLDQERTVASAIAAGVNYFDTAVLYGNGESERNLGRVLGNLKATNVVVGTKVRLPNAELGQSPTPWQRRWKAAWARLHCDRVGILLSAHGITDTRAAGICSAFDKSLRMSSPRSSGCGRRVRFSVYRPLSAI